MNLGQMRAGVYARMNLPTSDPVLTTQVVDGFVNDAVHFIETDRDWPWLQRSAVFVTYAGDQDYPPPADWGRIRELRISPNPSLEYLSKRDMDGRWPDPAVTGLPSHWTIEGERIWLAPVPDGTYSVTVSYDATEPALTADLDVPLLPARFHTAIVEAASWMAVRAVSDDARSAVFKDAYLNWQQKMVDDVRRHSTPGRVRVRPGGWL